jgi:hypothetical protein
MAGLKELMTLVEANYNYKCKDCGSTFGCGHDRISAMDKCEGDEICEQEQGCKECKSTNIVEVDEKGKELTEACKKKGKKKSKKEKKLDESNELVENRLDALESILEMVEEDALTSDETLELETSIEAIFNNVLEESQEIDYDEYYDEGDDYYRCTECDWEGSELDLDEDGNCPKCGAEVEEISEAEDDHLEEGITLKKTTSKQRAKAKRYRNSAAGKKALKLNLKKRKKYSKRISACAGKGKTFSMKKKTCIKSKKRR